MQAFTNQFTRSGRDFYNQTALGDDSCEINALDTGNEKIMNYWLNRSMLNTNGAVTDIGIFQSVTDGRFGIDNPPRPGDTAKASKIAFPRSIITMPFMGAGQTSIINPDLDSALTRTGVTTNKRSYNPDPIKSRTYRPMPMIDGIAREIQDPVHIVPNYWQWGGIDTHGQTRSMSYARENCL